MVRKELGVDESGNDALLDGKSSQRCYNKRYPGVAKAYISSISLFSWPSQTSR